MASISITENSNAAPEPAFLIVQDAMDQRGLSIDDLAALGIEAQWLSDFLSGECGIDPERDDVGVLTNALGLGTTQLLSLQEMWANFRRRHRPSHVQAAIDEARSRRAARRAALVNQLTVDPPPPTKLKRQISESEREKRRARAAAHAAQKRASIAQTAARYGAT
jgi:hypothetical protein